MKWKTDSRWARACSDCRLLLQQFKLMFFVATTWLAYCHRWRSISGACVPSYDFWFRVFFVNPTWSVCRLACWLLQVVAIMMIAVKLRGSRETASYLLPIDLWHSIYNSPFASHACRIFKEKVCMPAKRASATDAATITGGTSLAFASIFTTFHIWSLYFAELQIWRVAQMRHPLPPSTCNKDQIIIKPCKNRRFAQQQQRQF